MLPISTQKAAILSRNCAADMTDRQALNHLKSKGVAMNYGSIFDGVIESSPFINRVTQPTGRDRAFPYGGDHTVNPTLRDVLVELIEGDPESQA